MSENKGRRIESKDGKLFCKCIMNDDGNAILITKNCKIKLTDLLNQIYQQDENKKVRN